MNSAKTYDFVVAGAGVVGTAVAIELKRRFPTAKVLVLEKEKIGYGHASGRNSGVIHSGFYYAPGSLKAKMTAEGNARLTAYCEQKKIPLNRCGKLVVAKNEQEHQVLQQLLDRGMKNGSRVELIELTDARKIEPRVKSFAQALWSPDTKVAEPVAVLLALQADARELGVEFVFGCRVLGQGKGLLTTTHESYSCGFFINSAGLQADTLAHAFGFGLAYASLPFKGLYLYSSQSAPPFATNIYPVPDMNYPFLGVHVTLTLDGRAKLGPTAIPALWREQYHGMDGFTWDECGKIASRQAWFLLRNGPQFFKMAIEELRKNGRRFMVKRASALATGIESAHFATWGKPGIRSQLVDLHSAKLVMDFVIEGDQHSLHILNAVSPGWTCSMPFADLVCDRIQNLRGGKI